MLIVQWHPFSISSGPNENTAEIHVRGLGDYTKRLMEMAKSGRQHQWIRIDGLCLPLFLPSFHCSFECGVVLSSSFLVFIIPSF